MPFTVEGLNYLLDSYLGSGTTINTWFVGLISATSFSTITGEDTMTAHSGWFEFEGYETYSNERRRVWSWGVTALSATPPLQGDVWDSQVLPVQSVGGKSLAQSYTLISPTISHVVTGLFITSSEVRGGTGGLLLAAAQFNQGDQEFHPGDIWLPRYRVQMESTQS